MGPISDPAALSIVWRAALGVLVASGTDLLRVTHPDRLKMTHRVLENSRSE
jgi:hypothetical protein